MKIRRCRRGATLLESAIVLGVFSTFLWSGLELSLAVLRFNLMSVSARELARCATLHGEFSSSAWGPAPLSLTANDSHAAAQCIAPLLATLDPAEVTLELSWPDGSTAVGKRVQATVRCTHSPTVSIAAWAVPRELSATSRMVINH